MQNHDHPSHNSNLETLHSAHMVNDEITWSIIVNFDGLIILVMFHVLREFDLSTTVYELILKWNEMKSIFLQLWLTDIEPCINEPFA